MQTHILLDFRDFPPKQIRKDLWLSHGTWNDFLRPESREGLEYWTQPAELRDQPCKIKCVEQSWVGNLDPAFFLWGCSSTRSPACTQQAYILLRALGNNATNGPFRPRSSGSLTLRICGSSFPLPKHIDQNEIRPTAAVHENAVPQGSR
jgi:hypothetical protein